MKEIAEEFKKINGDDIITIWNIVELVEQKFKDYEFAPEAGNEILHIFIRPEDMSIVKVSMELDTVCLDDTSIYAEILGDDYKSRKDTEHFEFIELVIQKYFLKKKNASITFC